MAVEQEELPEEVRRHLDEVLKSSGMPDTEESRRRLAAAWREKKRLFEEQTRLLQMEPAASLPRDAARGALVLTLSGSLVSLGRSGSGSSLGRPEAEAGRRAPVRRAEYASIELRRNVPRLAVEEEARLAHDVAVNLPLEFTAGPVRATSAVLAIAVCGEEVSAEEEARRLREATIYLTNGFARINRTVLAPAGQLPDRFTAGAVARCVAARSGLSLRQARQAIDEYLSVVEAGMLQGERVPLGRLGRLSLRLRPARKARVGINPATGERLLVPARPPARVPHFSFSARLKAQAAAAPLDERKERGS